MKNIKIENVPCGANVLIVKDKGEPILFENVVDQFKCDGTGFLDLSYDNDDDIMIRVRCANEQAGYWRPIEIHTHDIDPDGELIVEMEKDRYLS